MRYINEQQENIVRLIDEYELDARAMKKLLEDKKLHLEIRKKVNKRTRSAQKAYDEINNQLKNEVIKISEQNKFHPPIFTGQVSPTVFHPRQNSLIRFSPKTNFTHILVISLFIAYFLILFTRDEIQRYISFFAYFIACLIDYSNILIICTFFALFRSVSSLFGSNLHFFQQLWQKTSDVVGHTLIMKNLQKTVECTFSTKIALTT